MNAMIPLLEKNETLDLPALTAELTSESLGLLAAATGFSSDGSVILREYARVLWAKFDEVLAVTTNYRSRILRPIDRPIQFNVEGALVRSWISGGRHFVEVATQVYSADSDELLVENSTTMLMIGGVRQRNSRSAEKPCAIPEHIPIFMSEEFDSTRILQFETATSLVWPDHPVANIHTDGRRSTQTGLTSEKFASGMMATSVVVGALRRRWPDWSKELMLDVRFRRPVVEGTRLGVFVVGLDSMLPPRDIVCRDLAGETVVEARLVPQAEE